MSRDTTRHRNWRHHYRIMDETGEFDVEIGNEHLAKKADRAIRILIRHGVHVVETAEARQHLAKFLRYKPRARIIRAPRVGWFEPRRGTWCFVLPGTLGDARIRITLDARDDASDRHGFRRSGTSQQWQEEIAAPLVGSSNVLLAVGVFLIGPLLRFAGEPGGGFHLFGPSKIGKSLANAIGQSVWGKPYFPGAGADTFGFSWDSTANRLEERAVLRSDIGLSLDEIGVGDPKAIANAVYKLSGGQGRGRWRSVEHQFNVPVLSTGELSLAEFLPDAKPGQLTRLADIPAEVQSGSAFESIPRNDIDAAAKKF
jgi:putative DNA primase/helicase